MVYALVATGFEESELIVPVDLLIRGGAEVKLVGVSGKTVDGAHGISIVTDCAINEVSLDDMSLLFLPGGQPGVNNLWEEQAVKDLVLAAAEKNIPIAAICAAPMILGRLGLLEGKNAICYPGCEADLFGAKLVNASVAVAGNIVTGKAAGAVFEFAGALLNVLGLDSTHVLRSVYYAE